MDYLRLSKTVAHALRHEPWEYGLEPDSQGWVPVEELLDALRLKREIWRDLTEDDLIEMIDSSDKKRYEISGDKIRAYYGHSLSEKIEKVAVVPPDILYHGTNGQALPVILKEGLKPMARQYVHLSADQETANEVGGRRRKSETIILSIQALDAHRQGIAFYKGHETIWLADFIPPDFIHVKEELAVPLLAHTCSLILTGQKAVSAARAIASKSGIMTGRKRTQEDQR